MENFESYMAEILEEESVTLGDEFESFDAWDSLAVLSIIALCDSEYNVPLSAQEINDSKTIEGLKNLIQEKM